MAEERNRDKAVADAKRRLKDEGHGDGGETGRPVRRPAPKGGSAGVASGAQPGGIKPAGRGYRDTGSLGSGGGSTPPGRKK